MLKDQQYADAIAKADQLFQEGDFENALKTFQTAADLKPNEQYPKDKIANVRRVSGIEDGDLSEV